MSCSYSIHYLSYLIIISHDYYLLKSRVNKQEWRVRQLKLNSTLRHILRTVFICLTFLHPLTVVLVCLLFFTQFVGATSVLLSPLSYVLSPLDIVLPPWFVKSVAVIILVLLVCVDLGMAVRWNLLTSFVITYCWYVVWVIKHLE